MRISDLQGKIDFLRDNFEKLEILKEYTFQQLVSQFERVDSVLRRLQTSIEALLDIGRYIISNLGLRIPSTNAEVIEILRDEGFIPEDDAQRYIQMVGFRNRVVHEYNTIDLELLYKILQEESNDLKKLFACLLKIIEQYQKSNPYKGMRFL